MSRCALLLCLLSLVSPLPVRAQQSGLLLGIRDGGGFGEGYRTLWIAPENGKVRVLFAGPDLIVPGKTGFWRTCVVHVSQDETEDGSTQHYESDSIVTEPATSSRAHCETQAEKSADESDKGYYCTSTDETRILFVGPNAISTQNSWEGNCGAHPSSAETVNLTSLTGGDTIAYLGITDSVRRLRLEAATTDAAREQLGDIGTVDSVLVDADGVPERTSFSTGGAWGVQRGQGYWHAIGEASCTPIIGCMQVQTFAVPKYRAPRDLVGHDELFPSFDTIKKAVPSARDAVSSPRRDLVVVLTHEDSLLVFVPHRGKLGAPVARIEASGDIVMAQWATGRFVPIWTAKLRELLPAVSR
ncbi:MAG TPA: hypothetical protein VJ865_07975 [Gemmatimonadaceae bacterium]|nr:hypothetical protein [Gemmatimonadaceae bacterium]